jgi:hypothetical protein
VVRLHLATTASLTGSFYVVFIAALSTAYPKAIPLTFTRRAARTTVWIGIKVPRVFSHNYEAEPVNTYEAKTTQVDVDGVVEAIA